MGGLEIPVDSSLLPKIVALLRYVQSVRANRAGCARSLADRAGPIGPVAPNLTGRRA